jgi:hypothetical protein
VKQVPGRRIGKVTALGNFVHLELDAIVITNNLFDLDGRTIRFTPAPGGFKAENLAPCAPLKRNAQRRISFGGGYAVLGLGRLTLEVTSFERLERPDGQGPKSRWKERAIQARRAKHVWFPSG